MPTAWDSYHDPLVVTLDQPIAGQNFPDNRSTWHGLEALTLGDGGMLGTQWYTDNGPNGLAANRLEPRAFCSKGAVSFAFTGVTLVVRLNIAYAWYNAATVTIDGVAHGTLSCDAASYDPSFETLGYLDVLVADTLANAAHTCVITVNQANPAKFFSMSGFKVYTLALGGRALSKTGGWLVIPGRAPTINRLTLTITNHGASTVYNLLLEFPRTLVDTAGAALAPLIAASLVSGASLTRTVMPAFTGRELSGSRRYVLDLAVEYVDPAYGVIVRTTSVNLAINDPLLTRVGTWGLDTSTPTGQMRAYTLTYGSYITFICDGPTLYLEVQIDGGRGVMGIYAANNTTLIGTVDCNAVYPEVVGSIKAVAISGITAGTAVYLRKTVNDGLYIVPVSVNFYRTQNFRQIPETVTLDYDADQPVAMPVEDVVVYAPDVVTYTPAVQGECDYVDVPPARENTHLQYTEALSRFPTFAVCYQGGFRDTLAAYDVLIIDPLAAHAADVIHWQSLGIKVFGYIASAEEVGFYSDRYNFSSALAPNSGSGPGGWAAYYMFTRYGTTGDTWVGTWTLPDKNGVWASFYTNPDPAFGWPARVDNYYAPLVLDGPTVYTNEVVLVVNHGGAKVFDTAHAPWDVDETITLTSMDGSVVLHPYADFTFDAKTGAAVLSATASAALISFGDHLKISYTRKGHRCDGVFWDVMDTPDVYLSHTYEFGYAYVAGYDTKFIDFINNFKINHPDALMISNRGFTVLPSVIANCYGVMFESWLTYPLDIVHLADTDYAKITDPAAIAYNSSVNTELETLRRDNTFEVFSLNYCLADERGDVLRDYCQFEDAKRGYLSWQSTITLTTPAHITTIDTPAPEHISNDFARSMIRVI